MSNWDHSGPFPSGGYDWAVEFSESLFSNEDPTPNDDCLYNNCPYNGLINVDYPLCTPTTFPPTMATTELKTVCVESLGGDEQQLFPMQAPDFYLFRQNRSQILNDLDQADSDISTLYHTITSDMSAPITTMFSPWRPSGPVGPSAREDVSRKDASNYYPSPMSSSNNTPQTFKIILPPHASTPMSTSNVSVSPLPRSEVTSRHSSHRVYATGTASSGSTRSICTSDSGYASINTSATPRPQEISDDDEDGSSESDNESKLEDLLHSARTGSKRKTSGLYIHVEDLFSLIRKKRRLDTPESVLQTPQVPDAAPSAELTSGSLSINANLAVESTSTPFASQLLHPHAQEQFQNRDSEQATAHNSGRTDNDDDGNNDSDDNGDDEDQDDEEDEVDEVDLPQQKLDVFHIFGLDTSHVAHHTSDSSSTGSGNRGGTTNGSSSATPLSAATNGSLTPAPTQPGADNKGSKSPGENGVAVDSSSPPPNLVYGPMELRCWHAANGIRCPRKPYSSPDVRHLIDDHSYSKRGDNHHRLPAKCQRCDRLFEDDTSSNQHKDKLKSPTPCDVLSPKQLEEANLELNSKGISPDRKDEIDVALRRFNRNKTLPTNRSQEYFEAWVGRNKPIHIGRSNRSEQVAERELGKWYVVWYTLFPDKEIPYHPFDDGGLDPKQCERILNLTMSNILGDSRSGLLPSLSQEHLDRIKQHFQNGIEIQCLELLQERNAKAKRARVQRPSRSPSSMATPAPKQPQFHFDRDHPGASTFKERSPGGAMGPPPSPDTRTPAAAPLTTIPSADIAFTTRPEAEQVPSSPPENQAVALGPTNNPPQGCDESSSTLPPSEHPQFGHSADFSTTSYSFQEDLSAIDEDSFAFQPNPEWDFNTADAELFSALIEDGK